MFKRKMLSGILIVLGSLYLIVCIFFYFAQERLIFFPEKLPDDFKFEFLSEAVEEMSIEVEKNIRLNGLLFKVENPKGLIVYFHGNAGSLRSWGEAADVYNRLGYDIFFLDYRGYGKSEGKIISEKQLFEDNKKVYEELKKRYEESKIIILGYSIGSGMASKLAASNNPKLLILQAPYYSMIDMVGRNSMRLVPSFLVRYPLRNYKHIQDCKMPIVVFHGDKDEVIPYESSILLKKHFKKEDKLITIPDGQHNGLTYNRNYQGALEKILK